jgi:hypothetical protein
MVRHVSDVFEQNKRCAWQRCGEDLESWMREQRAKLSRDNDVAKAIEYMLKRSKLHLWHYGAKHRYAAALRTS